VSKAHSTSNDERDYSNVLSLSKTTISSNKENLMT